jgi:hypothetical protein
MGTRRPRHHGYLAVAHTYPGWLPEMRGSSEPGHVPVGADAAEPFGDMGRRARRTAWMRTSPAGRPRWPDRGVAGEDVERGEHRGRNEPEGEAGVVVTVAPAAQDARRHRGCANAVYQFPITAAGRYAWGGR